jgi:acyl carrier protein
VSTPDTESLRQRIRAILVDDLSWEGAPEALGDDLPLIAEHVVDSLGLLRIVARLESEFGLEIRDEDVVASNFGSVAQMADFVARASGAG